MKKNKRPINSVREMYCFALTLRAEAHAYIYFNN